MLSSQVRTAWGALPSAFTAGLAMRMRYYQGELARGRPCAGRVALPGENAHAGESVTCNVATLLISRMRSPLGLKL
jgi:hypothetical protein